ncbi:hypothetical protein [Chitinophaga nivalis]|uniref:Sugar-binding protein n=1 Tax=Chitinophaga nivalis TaxID=2991709 RepID=A0ABT3IIT9_9BACT|nr:hypothetical protein [Chitinophaga nivalis]MCW3466438.1 hypothetical protein [Chitinophaga nivalis]MCW3483871.1 hypothetical protein [Chitinophaga nivalis]
MKRNLFLSLWLSLCAISTKAQERPGDFNSFSVQSPTAYAFSKVDNVPANLFTGQIQLSYPLFKKQQGDISFSLNMMYAAGGGLQAESPGSTVGRGWMLNTGGIITRHKRGVPDDYKNTVPYAWNNVIDDQYNGILFKPDVAYRNDGDYRVGYADPVFEYDRGISDSQFDIFEYNILGRSGKFYIGKDWQILNVPDQPLQIIPDTSYTIVKQDNQGINLKVGSKISAFTIIDEKGIRYHFQEVEINQEIGMVTLGNRDDFQTYLKSAYVSSWLLTKIVSPFNTDSVTIKYGERKFSVTDTDYKYYYNYQHARKQSNQSYYTGVGSSLSSKSNEPYISSITFSDKTAVTFDYFNTSYGELLQNPLIRKINFYAPGNELLKSTAFSYQGYDDEKNYLTINRLGKDTAYSNINRKQLFLESLNDITPNGNIQLQYLFDYYLDSNLYDRTRPYMGLDHWGYFNGKGKEDYLIPYPVTPNTPADRTPDLTYTRIGALKKIYYPTGGSEEFEYEPNDLQQGATKQVTGGLRIKKRILSNNASPAVISTREYKYTNTDGTSSGFLGDLPEYTYTIPIYHDNGSWPSNPQVKYYVYHYTSHPVNNLSYIEGSPVGYRRVEEIFGSTNNNTGKIVREYTDLSYTNLWAQPDRFPYRPIDRPTWALGQLLKEATYDKNGKLLRETIHEYDIKSLKKETAQFRSMYVAQKAEVDVYSSEPKPLRFVYSLKNYYPITGRVELKKTIENIYTDNNQTISQSMEYVYDPLYLVLKKVTRHLSGKDIIQKYFYPFDYNLGAGAAITKLLSKKIIAPQIATETWSKRNGVNEYLLVNAKVTDYNDFGNNFILPYKTYELFSDAPIVKNTLPDNSTPATQLLPYTGFQETVTLTQYNHLGRMLESRPAGGEIHARLIDDRDDVIAGAINTPQNELAFTSFETDYKGNWSFTGTAVKDATAPSGDKVFNIATAGTTGITKAGLTSSRTYVISYWIKGSALTIDGTTGSPLLKHTYNGWNLFTHEVTGKTTIAVKGNGMIDALCLYPRGATINTYSFKPGAGVTTVADPNTRMQYYSYDDFGRIKAIKDMDGNILKAHQYQVVKPNYNPTPVWARLYNFKCLPCPQNPAFTSNIQQQEMEDRNPASKTYGTRKWENFLSCGLEVTAWQPTGNNRCVKDPGNPMYNTGQKEREEKDMNPCSPSYNQTRWTNVGTDNSTCPDSRPIYVRVCVENRSGPYGDVVIRTFSDPQGNAPRPVSSLTVNVLEPGVGIQSILCDGTVNYMYRQVLVSEKPYRVQPSSNYSLAYETCY